jgi:phosphoribosylformylglycinamidine synthase
VGGNVSLYNEGVEGPIYPTPVVGMVGMLPDPARAGQLGFACEGDAIALVGPFQPELPGSELAKLRGEALPDGLFDVDLYELKATQQLIADAVRAGDLSSAHDVAEGGLAVALAECSLAGGMGASVGWTGTGDLLAELFGEGPGGFVVSGKPDVLEGFLAVTRVVMLGQVGGDRLTVEAAGVSLAFELDRLRAAHDSGLAVHLS